MSLSISQAQLLISHFSPLSVLVPKIIESSDPGMVAGIYLVLGMFRLLGGLARQRSVVF